MKWVLGIIQVFGGLVMNFWSKKKKEEEATHSATIQEALNTVGDSLAVEDAIDDEKEKIDNNPSNVGTEDGGINFDDFNNKK